MEEVKGEYCSIEGQNSTCYRKTAWQSLVGSDVLLNVQ